MLRQIIVIAIVALFVRCALADKITLQSGRIVEGQVLQKTDTSCSMRLDHGMVTLPMSQIRSIDMSPPAPLVKPTAPVALQQPVKRMPNWEVLTSALAKQKWATNLMQIPATVVDKGQM